MTPQAHHLSAIAEEMLLDAGLAQDAELRRALLAVGRLAELPVPVPSGRLAALLGEPVDAAPESVPAQRGEDTRNVPGDELGRRRRLRSHRPTVVGLALVAGMGMGVGTVAASPTGSAPAGSLSIQQMLEDWAPSWTIGTPQATAPGFLQQANDDDGSGIPPQQDAGLAGSEAPVAGDSPFALQSQPSRQASLPQSPGQVRNGAGGPSGVTGQGGAKEPGKNDGAAAQNGGSKAASPDRADQGTGPGNAPDAGEGESGYGVGPASGILAEAGELAGVKGNADSKVAKVMPGAKWLEKFVR
ncbi:hypothetical protein C3B78_02600 [Arthrobacter sp. PGP41]|uniref:hypothetical protein n=1 Tax=Arthrobacter sp. PGP41 TaxID=2079227 RepID=UPI000CDC09E2|nr:hypothetical protein [Arthrobacter sp. PGP41]AUZ33476.1 hypothetical protein C3B78_02600 [Arthrobacter sp. PGP41]